MSGQGWEVFVYSGPQDGFATLLAEVPGWTSLQISPLGSAIGAGSISIPLASPVFHQQGFNPVTTPVLAQETLWSVFKDGQWVFDFLAQSVDRTTVAADETQTVTISGPGTAQVLNWAMAMPTGWSPTGSGRIKTGSILDPFDEPNGVGGFTLDQVLWNLSNGASIASAGSATIALTPAGAYLGGGQFDMTNSSISASITPATVSGNLDGSENTEMIVKSTGRHGYARFALSGLAFFAEYQDQNGSVQRKVIAGGQQSTSGTVYGTQWAQFWRISIDMMRGGTQLIRWWTSGDGATWALKWSITGGAPSWNPNGVDLFFGGTYDASGTATVQVTGINGEVVASPANGPIFISVPVMSAYYQLLQAAQARGTIPFVTPTFTAAHDSNSLSWQDSWSLQTPAGTDLLSLLQNYAGAIGGDWIMKPGLQLAVGRQGSLGTDRTQQIVFHEGEVTQLGETRTRDQIYNITAAADGAGQIHVQESVSSIAQWAQRELWVSSGGTIDPQSALNTAAAAIGQFAQEMQARIIQIPPNQPGKTVFKDFGVFDYVGIERSDFSATDTNRVVGITVSVDQDGAETHELVLQTYRQVLAQFYQYLLSKFGGQAAAALGALPGGLNSRGLPVTSLPGSTAALAPQQAAGSFGGSFAGMTQIPSMAALPEVVAGTPGVIPGAMLTPGSVPQSAIGFTLPGGTQVTFSPTAPANPNAGDLWYNTSQGNQLAQWNGQGWTVFTFGSQAVGFTAQQIGGVMVFVQATTPTGSISQNSLWYDTAHSYRLNVFQPPSGWVPYQFGTGAIAAGSITAALIAANTITATQMAAGTITANEIAAGSITAQNIQAGTITSQLIAAQAITAALISAHAIDGMTINGNVINAAQINGNYIVLSGANDGVFAYGQPTTTVKAFVTVGGFSWVAPSGVTSGSVYPIGGGGGGSNGDGGNTGAGGAGGGGGGCGVNSSYPLTPGNTYFGSVGAAGTGGTSTGGPQNGTAGGDSWFNSTNTSVGAVTGKGGAGGQATAAQGGAGGLTLNAPGGFPGGPGGSNFPLTGGGGGGGGGAGGSGAGQPGGDSSGATGGPGGFGGFGAGYGTDGGPGGPGGPTGLSGQPGIVPGGGGGGGGAFSAGANGAAGSVMIVYQAGSTTLISALTGMAGADPVNAGNVPAGFFGPGLELTPQSSAPSPLRGDGAVYASLAGTPSAVTPMGHSGTLDITQTDVSNNANANAGTTPVTASWTIEGGDAQVGTVYEIEVPFDGVFQNQTLGLKPFLNGGPGAVFTSGGDTIGAGFFSAGAGFEGTVKVKVQIITTGVSGTANFFVSGGLGNNGARSSGVNNNNAHLSSQATGVAFNTTTNNTLAVCAVWGGSTASQTVTGHGSTFTRKGP